MAIRNNDLICLSIERIYTIWLGADISGGDHDVKTSFPKSARKVFVRRDDQLDLSLRQAGSEPFYRLCLRLPRLCLQPLQPGEDEFSRRSQPTAGAIPDEQFALAS